MYYLKMDDGIKIAVEDLNSTSSKVVVLVHGWPLSKEMYEYQKDFLVAMGYRVVSYDMRGFGNSDVSGCNYSYDRLASDLYCVIDYLKSDHITLVGFSMGGAICVHYMAMFQPETVSRLVLAGAAAPSFTRTDRNPYGMKIEEVNNLIFEASQDRPHMVSNFSRKVFALSHSKEFLKWFESLSLKASGVGTIYTCVSLRDEDVFEDLKKIKVKTAIFHGKMDQICPYGFATIMEKEIKDATLYPFEYSGHGLFYDEMNRFHQLLLEVMESNHDS